MLVARLHMSPTAVAGELVKAMQPFVVAAWPILNELKSF
jgi:hypothetical protein